MKTTDRLVGNNNLQSTQETVAKQLFDESLADMLESVDNYQSLFEAMGISVDPGNRISPFSADALAAGEEVSAETHWWGVDIIMNEKLTQDIIAGITTTGPVASAITAAFVSGGVITGPVGGVIAAGVAGIAALKIAEIKIVDNGSGVHWPISWLQWAILLAAVPTGPAGVLAAGAVFVHPLRN